MLNRLFYYKTIIINTMTKISDRYDFSKISITRLKTVSPPPPTPQPPQTKKITLNGQFCESPEKIYLSLVQKSILAKYADHTFSCPQPLQMSIRLWIISPPPFTPTTTNKKNDAKWTIL